MNFLTNNRRKFLKNIALGAALSAVVPEILAAAPAPKKVAGIALANGATILFQGDSITDAGRKKDTKDFNTPGALGSGYAMLAAAALLDQYPGKGLKIYNKGISGNKVYQLADRWDTDALDIKPDVLSLLVGVNDYWHTITNGYAGTITTYRNDLKTLLDRTRQKLPDVKLIIGEPFGVIGISAVTASWYPAFNDYRQAVKETAENFGAVFIPYQSVFDEAQKKAPGKYWTGDGVHPTLAGAQLMAHAWLRAVKG